MEMREKIQSIKTDYSLILDSIPEGISIADLDGVIIDINNQVLNMHRFTNKKEVAGKNALEFIAPVDRNKAIKNTQKCIDNGSVQYIAYQMVRSDGSEFPGELSASVLKDELGNPIGFVAITRDITERKKMEAILLKSEDELEARVRERTEELEHANNLMQIELIEHMQAESALRESQKRFQALIETTSDFIWEVDANSVYTYCSQQSRELWGYPPENFIGKTPYDQMAPEDRKQSLKAFQEMAKSRSSFRGLETRSVDSQGRPIVLETSGVPFFNAKGDLLGYHGITRDITRRKQAEGKIRESEEKIRQDRQQFEKIFNTLSEGVSLISPDGIVLQVNAAEEKVTGMKASEMIGKHFRYKGYKHLFPEGTELPEEETAVYQAVKRKRTVRNFSAGYINLDGSSGWLNINAVPILDEAGNVTSVVRTVSDITEQIQLLHEKEQFTKKLLEVQEEERKRIARELHDDTAQNLALLMLEIDNILQNAEALPEKTLSRLMHLKDDIDRTQKDVRRYSHELRPGVLDYLGLEPALEGLVEDLRARSDVETDLKISGEGQRLDEVVELAIFRIAQEATSNIRKHALATKAQIRLSYTPEMIKLSISDNGKGFKPSIKKKAGNSSGLGLIGMKERAHLIGATLRIQSSINKGTTVSVKAPFKPRL